MDYGMYAVYNSMTGFYEGISLFRTDAHAARRFGEAATKSGVDLAEYSLVKLGTFDILTAEMRPLSKPETIPFSIKDAVESEMDSKDLKTEIIS